MDGAATLTAVRLLTQQTENAFASISNDVEERVTRKMRDLLDEKLEAVCKEHDITMLKTTMTELSKSVEHQAGNVDGLSQRLDTLEEIVHSCISRLEDDHGVVKHGLVEVNQQIGESRSAFDDLREEVNAMKVLSASQQQWIVSVKAAFCGTESASPQMHKDRGKYLPTQHAKQVQSMGKSSQMHDTTQAGRSRRVADWGPSSSTFRATSPQTGLTHTSYEADDKEQETTVQYSTAMGDLETKRRARHSKCPERGALLVPKPRHPKRQKVHTHDEEEQQNEGSNTAKVTRTRKPVECPDYGKGFSLLERLVQHQKLQGHSEQFWTKQPESSVMSASQLALEPPGVDSDTIEVAPARAQSAPGLTKETLQSDHRSVDHRAVTASCPPSSPQSHSAESLLNEFQARTEKRGTHREIVPTSNAAPRRSRREPKVKGMFGGDVPLKDVHKSQLGF